VTTSIPLRVENSILAQFVGELKEDLTEIAEEEYSVANK
jgi:hypothetical protein